MPPEMDARGLSPLLSPTPSPLHATVKDGLSFEIKRLSLIKSLVVELQEETILKSSKDSEWPVSVR